MPSAAIPRMDHGHRGIHVMPAWSEPLHAIFYPCHGPPMLGHPKPVYTSSQYLDSARGVACHASDGGHGGGLGPYLALDNGTPGGGMGGGRGPRMHGSALAGGGGGITMGLALFGFGWRTLKGEWVCTSCFHGCGGGCCCSC